jgi:hypothetical protein
MELHLATMAMASIDHDFGMFGDDALRIVCALSVQTGSDFQAWGEISTRFSVQLSQRRTRRWRKVAALNGDLVLPMVTGYQD